MGLLDAVPPAPAETVVRKPKLARHGALFCSVLGDYRRGREATEFLALPSYGKALNSLRRAIKTGQGLKIETLASIIMLERTESVFDRGRDAISLKHTEAIATMIQNIGPPKADDQLHLGLVSDSYGTLVCQLFPKPFRTQTTLACRTLLTVKYLGRSFFEDRPR